MRHSSLQAQAGTATPKHYTKSSNKHHRTTLQLPGNTTSTIGTRVALRQPYLVFFHIELLFRSNFSYHLRRTLLCQKNGSSLFYAVNNWALLTRDIATTSRYWTQFRELALFNNQVRLGTFIPGDQAALREALMFLRSTVGLLSITTIPYYRSQSASKRARRN